MPDFIRLSCASHKFLRDRWSSAPARRAGIALAYVGSPTPGGDMAKTQQRRMPKPISARTHGMLDYGTAATVAALPAVLNVPRPARNLFEGLAAGYSGLSAMTDYPLS